jgi:hypothetical protein
MSIRFMSALVISALSVASAFSQSSPSVENLARGAKTRQSQVDLRRRISADRRWRPHGYSARDCFIASAEIFPV